MSKKADNMLELALVGAPSSGKSTFFKAATLKDVKIADYPFTTLEPNEGLAYVTANCPCKELQLECKTCTNGKRFIPIKLWDVAGLVEGAHAGRGRGNAFLDDIMQASAFIHVIDISGKTDAEGNPTDNFDPLIALTMLEKEIDYWILGLIRKDWNAAKAQNNALDLFSKRLSGLGITRENIKLAMISTGLTERIEQWSENDALNFVSVIRKQSKPSVIAANKIDKGGEKNFSELLHLGKLAFPVSAEIELALREATKANLIDYIPGTATFKIKENINITKKQIDALELIKAFLQRHHSTNVQDVLNACAFDLLGMIAIYPVENETKFSNKKGEILPDCFLMKKGSTSLDLAFQIHEDIGKKFISAVNARTKRNISSNYELQNGDIISIKSGR